MRQRIGALLVLALIVGAGYLFLRKSELRDPKPGELVLSGQIARGPGRDCWLLNANTGERFAFVGNKLGRLRTVGASVQVIATPLPDKRSECFAGRVISIVDYKITKLPDYN